MKRLISILLAMMVLFSCSGDDDNIQIPDPEIPKPINPEEHKMYGRWYSLSTQDRYVTFIDFELTRNKDFFNYEILLNISKDCIEARSVREGGLQPFEEYNFYFINDTIRWEDETGIEVFAKVSFSGDTLILSRNGNDENLVAKYINATELIDEDIIGDWRVTYASYYSVHGVLEYFAEYLGDYDGTTGTVPYIGLFFEEYAIEITDKNEIIALSHNNKKDTIPYIIKELGTIKILDPKFYGVYDWGAEGQSYKIMDDSLFIKHDKYHVWLRSEYKRIN